MIIDRDFLPLIERAGTMVNGGRAPVHPASIALLNDISRTLLSAPTARRIPHLVALGYWLRAASVARLCQELESAAATEGVILAPRGLALHLPPTNVETLFIYSWALSVLAGNCNIVRLPSEQSEELEWLVLLIEERLRAHGEEGRHVFSSFAYDGPENDELSSFADLRMIWGGDEKVNSVSRTPIRPDGLSIGFPTRTSIAVISTEQYRTADDKCRTQLAAMLFNDMYWFDQLGCGSPRVLFWIGDPGEVANDLFERLTAEIKLRHHQAETSTAVAKFRLMNDLLASGTAKRARRFHPALDVVEADDPEQIALYGQGGGFLSQITIDTIDQIAKFATRRLQTIAHFGVPVEELRRLGSAIAGRGGYRIVPIGQALQFDALWDGVPLLTHMTRRIRITHNFIN